MLICSLARTRETLEAGEGLKCRGGRHDGGGCVSGYLPAKQRTERRVFNSFLTHWASERSADLNSAGGCDGCRVCGCGRAGPEGTLAEL